ncbi:hypothetical protein AVEN_40578-1 [Araneus ventricosus]|uniref:Uncharacterized protein n=1 Tax=Araneus ventricosus TaxID=182803 RepID=A0A4Y2LXT7_ARAVE|nr:hypothetical protein AVEN_40578-1 [Araneus ventricosus]
MLHKHYGESAPSISTICKQFCNFRKDYLVKKRDTRETECKSLKWMTKSQRDFWEIQQKEACTERKPSDDVRPGKLTYGRLTGRRPAPTFSKAYK